MLIFLRFIKRVKIITTLHNIVPHEIKYITLERLLFKLILTLSNSIIVHSKIAKLILAKLYNMAIKKINVIPHGNFIKQYPNKVSMAQAREKLGILQNRFVILFFGHVRRYKGLEIILDFLKKFDELPETIKKEILFLFAGCFREKDFLYSLLKLRDLEGLPIVIYDKFVDNNDVQYFMNSCDIGLIPYESITTPGSLLLFMSFKKPVIISRYLNILELANEKFCIFLREYSGDGLSLAIRKAYFLWRLGRLEKMGKHSYNEALKYDWKIISDEHFKLFVE
jgi:glycosyltransferase involved in cell wall biosynthesis